MNLLCVSSLSALFAMAGSTIHAKLALSDYKYSLAANPLDDRVQTFHEEYGWWANSAERLLLGVWSPVFVGATLGVIAFSISAEMIGRNREQWIEIVSLPITSTLKGEWQEFVLTWRVWGVAFLGFLVLIPLNKWVFPENFEGILAYAAASVVVYPTWRSVYAGAKDRLTSKSPEMGRHED